MAVPAAHVATWTTTSFLGSLKHACTTQTPHKVCFCETCGTSRENEEREPDPGSP